MRDDGFGHPSGIPLPRSADPAPPSSGPAFAAPVTLGRSAWQRRHRHAAMAVDVSAVGCVPLLNLLWQQVVALPLVAALLSAVALSLGGRGLLQLYLRHLRRHGRAMSSVLVVGTDDAVAGLADATRRAPALGWRVGAACTSTGAGPAGTSSVAGVPVLGDLDSVAVLALFERFDAVAVCPTPGWTTTRLQQLAWDLDCSRTALLVDPRLVRHADRGVRATGVLGLPLVQLTHHEPGGPLRLAKEVANRLGALVLLVLVAPVLLSCAVTVRRDGGPALVRRTRVGHRGRSFSMLSFRTTNVQGEGVSPVGRVLRRHGLDGLPQLFNVLAGSMALVGPRPPVPGEQVDAQGAARRLLVKPGITVPSQPRGPRGAARRAASGR